MYLFILSLLINITLDFKVNFKKRHKGMLSSETKKINNLFLGYVTNRKVLIQVQGLYYTKYIQT